MSASISKVSRQNIWQFVLYNFGGAAFFIIGYALFALLYGVLHWEWWWAKIVADLTGWTANYLIQRFLAFRDESKDHAERVLLGKFIVLSLANVPIDYAIVGGLNALGVSPFIGLIVSAGFFTVWKFAWYKFWAFRRK